MRLNDDNVLWVVPGAVLLIPPNEAELPRGTFHGLRHSFATALLTANVHPEVVQSALGHSSITLTIDTYSHVMPGLEEAAARRIDDVLGDAVAGNP